MKTKKFFGEGLPGVDPTELSGKLVVLEGADGSGRSTQIRVLTEWFEQKGYAVINVGLKRSSLVAKELDEAKQGNVLAKITLSLFYATDFADQLENIVIPALRAGFIVLADRYIYTLMARDLVRGLDKKWVESIYSLGIVPDVVFYIKATPQILIERNFQKNPTLNYWESGMDIGLSNDMFESFIRYQMLINKEFRRMESDYGFVVINGNQSVNAVSHNLKTKIEEILFTE
ncbi:dTMP kinase [Candidatus Auribacterota bacterium]